MRWITRLAVIVLAVAVLGPLVGISPAVAQQEDGESSGRGIDRLLQSPDLQGDEAPTVEERYPQSAYTMPNLTDTGGLGVGDWAESATLSTGNFLADQLLAGAALVTRATNVLLQWAFDARLTGWLADELTGLLDGVADTVWGPLVLISVVLGAGWVAWQALARQRGTTGMSGAVWMIATIAFATVLLAQPGWFFGSLNDLSTEISAEIFSGIAAIGATGGGDGAYYGDTPPTFAGNTDSEQARRQASDRLWHIFVWEPWTSAVFANDRDANQHAERLLNDPSEDTQEGIRDDLQEQYGEDAYPVRHFVGRNTSARISVAALGLLAALATSVVMLVLTTAVIVLQFASLLLTIIAPLALLIGVHPGVGRTVTMQWLELWLGAFLKRIIITTVLAAVVAVQGLIMQHTLALGWIVAATLIVVTAIAALMYRKALAGMLSRLSASSPQPGADAGQRLHGQRTRPGHTGARTGRRAAWTTAIAATGGKAAAVWAASRRRGGRSSQQPADHGQSAGPSSSGGGGGGAAGGGPSPPPPRPSPGSGSPRGGPTSPPPDSSDRESGRWDRPTRPQSATTPASNTNHQSRADHDQAAPSGNGHAGGLASRGLAHQLSQGHELTPAGRKRLADLRQQRSPMIQPPAARRWQPHIDPNTPMGRPDGAPWSRWARQRTIDRQPQRGRSVTSSGRSRR